jgi:hypothetical protein
MTILHTPVSNACGPSSLRACWVLAGLVLFGMSFGFVEAAVVVDLRTVLDPIAQPTARTTSGGVFPLLTIEQLDHANPRAARLMRIEICREAATLLMLAGIGLAAGRNFVQRFAAFSLAFGIWDLCYYLGLKLIIDWPASFWTWDVLFLIPVPWAAPVLAPVLVAISMVVTGSTALLWEAAGRLFRAGGIHWAAIVAGGSILVVAFCWNSSQVAGGGVPSDFPWPLYLAGEVLACCAFLHAYWLSRQARTKRADESRVQASQVMLEARAGD